MKGNIILIGGEGYIGQIITQHLFKKNKSIISYDNLIYKQDILSLNHIYYKFVKGDIRDQKKLNELLTHNDQVVILAGLVGDPITKKYPDISEDINNNGIKNIIDLCLKKNVKNLIFVSTCSNYGLINNDVSAKETHKLNPLSAYAKSKVNIEKYLMTKKNQSETCVTILRFSTAFGLSKRMRYDLTVNEFVKDIYFGKKLDVYDPDTWRPYCHVSDFAKVINHILEFNRKKIYFEIFNIGNINNNFTKRMIIDKISKELDCSNVNFVEKKGSDIRNYKVDFSKLEEFLKIKCNFSVEKGILEIINHLKKDKTPSFKLNTMGNYIL